MGPRTGGGAKKERVPTFCYHGKVTSFVGEKGGLVSWQGRAVLRTGGRGGERGKGSSPIPKQGFSPNNVVGHVEMGGKNTFTQPEGKEWENKGGEKKI